MGGFDLGGLTGFLDDFVAPLAEITAPIWVPQLGNVLGTGGSSTRPTTSPTTPIQTLSPQTSTPTSSTSSNVLPIVIGVAAAGVLLYLLTSKRK